MMNILSNFKILLALIMIVILSSCQNDQEQEKSKPRVLISTDIGGTDPDDFQSMIHLLMYADLFEIEGLVSSPYGPGRKAHLTGMIDLYEQDLPQLKKNAPDLPAPQSLRDVCKQGGIKEAPYKGYRNATEGSDWIIKCAKKESDQPLWVLVWGGIEDLAQALYDAPEIKENIRVYWIGGPNKKWGVNAYAYIAENHPDLWMIEANATYRGWFLDENSPKKLKNEVYNENYIQARGALGKEFKNHYEGRIKMGDTPSLAYLMNGDPNEPEGDSWGGSFLPIERSSRYVFKGNTTTADTIAAYGVIEWVFEGPELDIPADSSCFTIKIQGQIWPGFYLSNGKYGVRYASKKPEVGNYETSSSIQELDGLTGQYVSTTPWPGKSNVNDYVLGKNWYGDRPEAVLFIGDQQGAKTVARYRKAFLMDWAKRWAWLSEK